MSNYPFDTFPLTKRVGIVNPVANLDARYGPWPTLNDALTGFNSAVREQGLTLAVSGVNGITEYWYKDGITDSDLVLKATDIVSTVTDYLSTNNITISALTITGDISATEVIYAEGGNSNLWNSSYTNVQSNSANWNTAFDRSTVFSNVSSRYDGSSTAVESNSANWNNAYNTGTVYQANSSSYATYNFVNSNFLNLTGGTIEGNLTLSGNFYIAGSAATINAVDLVITDPLIYLAEGNPSDILDIGFTGSYNYDSDPHEHTGFVRSHNTKKWTLFSGLTAEVLSALTIDFNDPSLQIDTLKANLEGNVIGGTVQGSTLSSTGIVYSQGGNSDLWNTAFDRSTVFSSVSGRYNSASTAVESNSANWNTAFDRSTVFSSVSSRYDSSSTVVESNSANWNFGYNVATYVQTNSASWEESAEIIPTVTNYLSTNNITLCSVEIGKDYYFSTQSPTTTGLYGSIIINSDASYNTITQRIADYISVNPDLANVAEHVTQYEYVNLIPTLQNYIVDNGFVSTYLKFQAPHKLKLGIDVPVYIGNQNQDFTVLFNSSTNTIGISSQKSIITNSTVSAQNGNSNQWNSTYTTVQSNSATTWNYQGTDLKALSANWQGTFTNVQANSASWENLTNTTFSELTSLKANNQLAAGKYYRISDFQLMWWNQSINDTTVKMGLSAEPLIVLALSGNKISHEAKSELYPQDTVYYDIDATSSNSWGTINNNTAIPNFKGWIYRRIDHKLNIDIPWDWRHITVNCCRPDMSSISLYSSLSTYNLYDVVKNASDKLYYSIQDNNTNNSLTNTNWWLPVSDFTEGDTYFVTDESYGFRAYNKNGTFINLPADTGTTIQQPTFTSSLVSQGTFQLTNCNNIKIEGGYSNVFLGISVNSNTIGNSFYYNTIGNNLYNNTIGNNFYYNTIGNNFYFNTIGNSFNSNTIGNSFSTNTIGNNFYFNTIGNFFYYNTIGSRFYSNTIGNSFNSNTIGNSFYYNTIGNNLYSNTIGNFFYSNTIGNNFNSNTIGNFFDSNTIGSNFFNNTIGNGFDTNTIGNSFYFNTIGNSFDTNTIGNSFNFNTIGNSFYSNTIGNNFRRNTVEDDNTIGNVTGATHIYNNYNTRLFSNSNNTVRLSYFNSSDQLVVTDPTA